MDKNSTKYIVLWSAVLSVMALNTTRINAEETPGSTVTGQPTADTESSAPTWAPEPTISAVPEQQETSPVPSETPVPTEKAYIPSTSSTVQKKVTVSHGDTGVAVKPGEHLENGHWIYVDGTNGKKIISSFKYIDSLKKTVYYDENGYMVYGLHQVNGKKYYFLPGTGAMQYGEKLINGHWYYFDPKNNGAASTGITNIGYKTVCYDGNGYMVYGLQQVNGKKYYFHSVTGAMQYGEKLINGHWYYFDPKNNGAASVGLTNIGYKTVYYNSNGQMLYGSLWLQLNGDAQKYLYHFDTVTGKLGTHGWVKDSNKSEYYVDENNHLVTGEKVIGGKTYYFDNTGLRRTGWIAENRTYYTNDGQKLQNPKGEKYIEGHWYYFKPDTGAMAKGLTNIGYKTVYYDNNGRMQYGEKNINGHWYNFDKWTGAMSVGLTNLGYKTVYYNSDGQMHYGEKNINGDWYYFKPGTGEMAKGLTNIGYKNVYYDNNGRMVHHDFDLNGVHYSVNSWTGEAKVGAYRHGTVPYMKQTDPRWSNRKYGGMTMGSTACGVTTIAMNLTAWKRQTILPPTVADYLHAVGEYNVKSAGTTGYSRIAAGNHWGLKVDKITSLQQMKTALAQGKTISEMSGAGYFSNGSHGITIFGNNNGKATAYDPYNSGNNGSYSIDYLWNARSKDPADYDAGAVIFAFYK